MKPFQFVLVVSVGTIAINCISYGLNLNDPTTWGFVGLWFAFIISQDNL